MVSSNIGKLGNKPGNKHRFPHLFRQNALIIQSNFIPAHIICCLLDSILLGKKRNCKLTIKIVFQIERGSHFKHDTDI